VTARNGTQQLALIHCMAPARPVVVAIPAKDEADRISACLRALAGGPLAPDAVVLLANNCTDDTCAVAAALMPELPYALHIRHHLFSPALANAGNARRAAMQWAADLAGPHGLLLTTDADTNVMPKWVQRNVTALLQGAELVCGRVRLDAAEAAIIPPNLWEDDALEQSLTELLDQLADRLDPDPADPWPRHTEASGASLAVSVEAYIRAGGVPAMASGEDRAFVHALARVDARIRHDPSIIVVTSGRLDGRASGGMAETIRRRMRQQDEYTDDSLEPAVDAYRRIDFRRRVRRAWRRHRAGLAAAANLSIDLGIPAMQFQSMLKRRYFGAAWEEIESRTPFLRRRRVRFADLPREIALARQLLAAAAVAEAEPLRPLDHPT
jgi:hypothetical protein